MLNELNDTTTNFRTDAAAEMARDLNKDAIEQIIDACEDRARWLRARAQFSESPKDRVALGSDATRFSDAAHHLRLLVELHDA